MKDGYIRVAAGSVDVHVANPEYNKAQILDRMRQADELGVNLLVLPELCLTGYTCGDLLRSSALLDAVVCAAQDIVRATAQLYPIVVFGLPLRHQGEIYNCAAVAGGGKLLGVVPKTQLCDLEGCAESRYFAPAMLSEDGVRTIRVGDLNAPFDPNLLFCHDHLLDYAFGVELGQVDRTPISSTQTLCPAGATVIANPCASCETVGKAERRRMLLTAASARMIGAYVCANASSEESTQDVVFSAHHMIVENGRTLAENEPFGTQAMIVCDVDTAHLSYDRRRETVATSAVTVERVTFDQPIRTHELVRVVEKNPFLPASEEQKRQRAKTILEIQSCALARRLAHTRARTAVIGISGGLDSTLALLVAVRAMKRLGRPNSDILALTMPCFGTTERTKSNAIVLCERLGVTLRQIDISAAVHQHFADIGHAPDEYDVTFENAQARERTQVLMDVANQTGGIVIGTGDLSELSLGWATYNGDHMSMYGVNADVPKTVVRELVRYEACTEDGTLARVLWDILDTPVSPELLPADAQGDIAQKTEDLVGPYELHDFFLYYMVRYGDAPGKMFRLARLAFDGEYGDEKILHWMRVFHRRFFAQQFKRSCLPDGPKVGSVSLSPRGDWLMPTDADGSLWQEQIEALEKTLDL